MNEQEAIGYSVYVGIDWANSKHDVCIQPKSPDEREFEWSGNYLLTYIYEPDIPPVPIPAAFWLFGTALVGFVGMSRRRKVG